MPGEAAVRYGRRLVELLQQRTADGYVARVDLRLRPAPEVTPIVLPVGAAISYYESSALPWERAAFIRARAAPGDIALGERFLAEIQPFIWRRAIDFGAIDEIRDISLRIRDHFAQGQGFGPGYDLKRGRGGIREAEFFTQVQQLVHGGRDPGLRASSTLDALAALSAAGRLDADVAATIGDAYRALRTAEHRVQMIDDRQEHRLPADPAALDAGRPARRTAPTAPPCSTRCAAMSTAVGGAVRRARQRARRAPVERPRHPARRTHRDGVRARRGAAPRRRLALGPRALAALARGARGVRGDASQPDARGRRRAPTRAARSTASATSSSACRAGSISTACSKPGRSSPRLVAQILTHAPGARRPAGAAPDLARRADRRQRLRPAARRRRARRAASAPRSPATRSTSRSTACGGWSTSAASRSGVQLIAAHRDPIAVAEGYSDLAEAAIVALSAAVTRDFAATHGQIDGGELIVLALGRLGGRALTHASDLDLVYLFDAPDGARSDGAKPLPATDYYNRLASRISAALSVPTAAGPLYEVDTRLRPQGAQGMLAVSLAAFDAYQRDEAWTWEHMALCRARAADGSAAMRGQMSRAGIVDILQRPARRRQNPRRRRQRCATTWRATSRRAGPLDIKLGPGGLVDLEFAVHALQLTHHVGLDPRLEVALAALVEAGLIDAGADPDLRLLSRMLVVLRLVAPEGMEPAEQSRALVADACAGMTTGPHWSPRIDAARQADQRPLGGSSEGDDA